MGSSDTSIQLINEHQQFSSDLDKTLEEWGLTGVGFGYSVVAVFGSQSSGKSTLLNELFSTQFKTMRSQERSQTTRGIWAAKAHDAKIVVLDVEGTDGREHGEDQGTVSN